VAGAGVVGFLATLYLQARTKADSNDSQFISSANGKEQNKLLLFKATLQYTSLDSGISEFWLKQLL